MNPAQLAAMLGVTLADIAASAGEAVAWKQLGSVYRSPSQFAREYLRYAQALGNFPAKVAQSLANYWAFQGQYLAMLAPNMSPPRDLAAVIPRSPREAASEANYRYDVAITLHFPVTGDQQTMYVHVDTPVPMSVDELHAEAFEQLLRGFRLTNYNFGMGDEYEYFDPEFEVAGFYRLY